MATTGPTSRRVGVIGASGYVGAELLRLLSSHDHFDVELATADSGAGERVCDLYPSLASSYPELVFRTADLELTEGLDVVFLALPHGASQDLVPELRKRVGLVVDLAADFRLKDASLYPTWYGEEHHCPEMLAEAAYGLPELFRSELPGPPAPTDQYGAGLVAAAGCFVTAAALALAPLVRAGVVVPEGIVVDAASGVSGAGRGLKAGSHFCSVDEGFSAYGLDGHRHTPEIEQATGAQVIFTPHLAPMNRGILATCYSRPTSANLDPLAVLADAYKDEPFIVVDQRSPTTKSTLGSNSAHLTARHDKRSGWCVSICALDNLVKGAAGQAIQCANAAVGLPETAGLPIAGIYP